MTAQYRLREEVVNTQLAILLSRLGMDAEAKTIHLHGRYRPDVLFHMRGLRVVVEGKYADSANADEVVLQDARDRVRSGIAHIAAAAVYPSGLRTTETRNVTEELERANLRYRIVSEGGETDTWFEGTPAELLDALRHAQEALTRDDIVEETAKSLSARLDAVTARWLGQRGACDRLSALLGLSPPRGETEQKAQDRRETAARVSALVLANAYIFQEQLASSDGRITPLRKLARGEDLIGDTAKHWKWVWGNINYVPIFQLGERVLNELPASAGSDTAVRGLLEEAAQICGRQAALRHDLMGRIYHWLLHHAKYLGTYYTSVPAATLLLKLALASEWTCNFSEPSELAEFKVADLACGTGTLLMAAAHAISDAYIRSRAASDLPLDAKDMSTLHRTLMENVLHGYDVLPSAVHLTASTLALLAPEVAFVRMGLFVMPLGVDHGIPKLGSLDFLTSDRVQTQMALDYSHTESIRTGAAFSSATTAELPRLDLCVMNPPFVRSVGGNLLFGSLPDERGLLQTELKRRVRVIGASATAGLGSVFVALAHRWLKPGGRLAFVLPAALVSGEAWADTRRLLSENYQIETIVTSHDDSRPNFSENTSLSEVLFIARKREPKQVAVQTKYINLWHNPRSIHEALDLASRILRESNVADLKGSGTTTIAGPVGKLAEVVVAKMPAGDENWTPALFAQTQLARICCKLANGRLHLPGSKACTIEMCRLDLLGSLGYDRRDIHDAFTVSTHDWSPFPAFWSHESDRVRTIAQFANAYLLPRETAAPGRRLKAATDVWSKAGRILVAERLRTNTHRVVAVGFENDVLGNTWWAFRHRNLTLRQARSLLLWLNSSASILLFYGRRVITEGAWMQMKKPAWEAMPVLNVRELPAESTKALEKHYLSICEQELAPWSRLGTDDVRRSIDDQISDVLGLPSLSPIRELLRREPGFVGSDAHALS